MSVEKSLAMIVEAVKKFKLSGIWIRDDEFYVGSFLKVILFLDKIEWLFNLGP